LLLVLACRLDKLVKPALHDRLIITPAELQETSNSGSHIPVTQTLRLASADGATLTWTAVDHVPWLGLSSSGGGAPDSVTVTLDADTLPQSIRHDTIAFVAAEMPGDTIRVLVMFTVLAPSPELTVTPLVRLDSAFAGSLAPRRFVVRIDNTGGARIARGLRCRARVAARRRVTRPSSRCRRTRWLPAPRRARSRSRRRARSARRLRSLSRSGSSHARRRPSSPTRSSPGRSSWPTAARPIAPAVSRSSTASRRTRATR